MATEQQELQNLRNLYAEVLRDCEALGFTKADHADHVAAYKHDAYRHISEMNFGRGPSMAEFNEWLAIWNIPALEHRSNRLAAFLLASLCETFDVLFDRAHDREIEKIAERLTHILH